MQTTNAESNRRMLSGRLIKNVRFHAFQRAGGLQIFTPQKLCRYVSRTPFLGPHRNWDLLRQS